MNEEVQVYCKDGKYLAVIGEEVLPVTSMLGTDGEEVDNYENAVVVVAGPDKDQMWVTIELVGPVQRVS